MKVFAIGLNSYNNTLFTSKINVESSGVVSVDKYDDSIKGKFTMTVNDNLFASTSGRELTGKNFGEDYNLTLKKDGISGVIGDKKVDVHIEKTRPAFWEYKTSITGNVGDKTFAFNVKYPFLSKRLVGKFGDKDINLLLRASSRFEDFYADGDGIKLTFSKLTADSKYNSFGRYGSNQDKDMLPIIAGLLLNNQVVL